MRTLLVIAMLCGTFAVEACAEAPTLTIDKFVPTDIGQDWVRRQDAGARAHHSWVHFDNKQHPGEVLAFLATKIPPGIDVRSSPVRQASIEMFEDNGSASFSVRKSEPSLPIKETVRHRIVSINFNAAGVRHDPEAIEYTYLYGPGEDASTGMGHGYVVVAAETVLFVQHTSPRVISSDVAFEMVAGMLAKHLQLAGKPHGYSKSKVVKSYD